MKIDPSTPSAIPLPRTSKGASPSPAGGADAVHGGKDVVQLSSGQVHSLPDAPNADFDAARVAAIREDIRAGRYEVHPERIARGLLASVRELLDDNGKL
ncbi:negative regulator of flagellin synthesis FlgM [Variovorax sp. TBS-050B]|uniref:flagellar biosynthesis anti-sigma factor FlgM n=1 Tax=Variovorax sp. TBS-050B TaxID=2940551 RepID=UPI00247380D6|nr:flagellar biosynthesis anti-sigma factor FlgM [Variovorax sp. TBS-050B]MDH6591141.1 negative regulator of flagellin synthesis FlgM [Variovorax sp. TBS-050B]